METVQTFTVTTQYAAQWLISNVIKENLNNVIKTLTLDIIKSKENYRHSLTLRHTIFHPTFMQIQLYS